MEKWWTPQVAKIKALSLEERKKIAVDLDPFLIVNVEKLIKGSKNHQDIIDSHQILIDSIRKEGQKCPIIVCPIVDDPNKYGILFGRHRAVVCQFLGIKVKAHIIKRQRERRM